MSKKINRLIHSMDAELIANRFLVKISEFDSGVHPKSILITTVDLLENNFKMHFYTDVESASNFIKILRATE